MHLLNLHPSPPAPGQCWADTLQTENGVLSDHPDVTAPSTTVRAAAGRRFSEGWSRSL